MGDVGDNNENFVSVQTLMWEIYLIAVLASIFYKIDSFSIFFSILLFYFF